MAKRKITEIAVQQPITLEEESKSIVSELIPEKDPDKIKNLIDLFNLNQSKKNLARADKYNTLLDKISDELVSRVSLGSMATMTDGELMEYLSAVNTAMAKVSVDTENIIVPAIQQNNTQVNINMVELDRGSREKVADAVKAILAKASNGGLDIIDSEG